MSETNPTIAAMGLLSETGALLIVRTQNVPQKTLLLDASLSELRQLEEQGTDIQDLWLAFPTSNQAQPLAVEQVDEVLQAYCTDGTRDDDALLRCRSGATYRMNWTTITLSQAALSFWRGKGVLTKSSLPDDIEIRQTKPNVAPNVVALKAAG